MIEKDHLGDWSPEKDSNKMIFFNQGMLLVKATEICLFLYYEFDFFLYRYQEFQFILLGTQCIVGQKVSTKS